MNNLNIIARIAGDPELITVQTPNGDKYVCNFSVAYNEKKGGNNVAHFFDVVAWERNAETVCNYFAKGQRIGITGKLTQERFQDKQGNNRSKAKIQLYSLSFIEPKSTDNTQAEIQQHNSYDQNTSPFLNDVSNDEVPF